MNKLILAAAGFVVIYNVILFGTSGGINNGIFFTLLSIFYFLFKKPQAKNINLGIIFSIFSIIFGFLIGFRSSEIVQFINLLAALGFSSMALYFYKSESPFSFSIFQFILTPLVVAKSSLMSLSSFGKGEGQGVDKTDPDSSKSIIRGIVIALPILAILMVLLTNADPVFKKLAEDLFSDIWQRLIVSAILFVGLIGFGLTKIYEIVKPQTQTQNSKKSIELLIVCGSIVTLLGLFLVIQFEYFFSNIGETQLQQLGLSSITYSEYVRKGFFELLAASGICALVAIYVMRYIHNFESLQKFWLQIISSTLVVEIGLLVLSAMQRVNLYSQAHGLTRARILGFIFLVWLSMLLVVFLVGIIKKLAGKQLFWPVILISVFVLFNVNVIDVDGLIANKYRPSVNGEIDYYYLVNLSPDAVSSWEESLTNSVRAMDQLENSKAITDEEYRQFYWARLTIYDLNDKIKHLNARRVQNKLASFNYSEYQAFGVIDSKKQVFDLLPRLVERTDYLWTNKVPDSLRYSVPADRPTEPPLI